MTTEIKEHFANHNQINYRDIIYFCDVVDVGFKVREVIDDLVWKLEAYYEDTIVGIPILIVFDNDIISPKFMLNQEEFKSFIKRLQERKKYVQKSLSPRNS